MSKGNRMPGDHRPNAKLDRHLIHILKERHDAGASYAELGREHGLHPTTIMRALTGQTWDGEPRTTIQRPHRSRPSDYQPTHLEQCSGTHAPRLRDKLKARRAAERFLTT